MPRYKNYLKPIKIIKFLKIIKNIVKNYRFRQIGELIRFKKMQRYLIVNVLRAENIISIDDRAIINSYITVQWAGVMKRT